eukprot:scaffold2028_cov181-Ochromonas_danica.AAC.16
MMTTTTTSTNTIWFVIFSLLLLSSYCLTNVLAYHHHHHSHHPLPGQAARRRKAISSTIAQQPFLFSSSSTKIYSTTTIVDHHHHHHHHHHHPVETIPLSHTVPATTTTTTTTTTTSTISTDTVGSSVVKTVRKGSAPEFVLDDDSTVVTPSQLGLVTGHFLLFLTNLLLAGSQLHFHDIKDDLLSILMFISSLILGDFGTGQCNAFFDETKFFRYLEKIVYQLTGNKPMTWKHDERLEEEAMGSKKTISS